MGIQGLLPNLRDIQKNVHVKKYKGQTVAIDGYVWLHKGVYACSRQICLGEKTTRYMDYFLGKIKLLLRYQVVPYVVFDGGYLPSKKGKEEERAEKREKNLKAGHIFEDQGLFSKAEDCFRKAVDITPTMAFQVIKVLKQLGIKYVVAPYEADAQLAYLFQQGKVSAVISEDSDLLTFGCGTVLFKLEHNGNCQEIDLNNLGRNKILRFDGWNHEMFQFMCIFAGCDYLNLAGVGIKTAHQIVNKYRTNFRHAIKVLRIKSTKVVPKDYEENFGKALFTFKHQAVFCRNTRQLVRLQECIRKDIELDFAGKLYEKQIAQGVSNGTLHPETKRPILEHEEKQKHLLLDRNDLLKKASKIDAKRVSQNPKQKTLHSFFSVKPKSKSNSKQNVLGFKMKPAMKVKPAANLFFEFFKKGNGKRKSVESEEDEENHDLERFSAPRKKLKRTVGLTRPKKKRKLNKDNSSKETNIKKKLTARSKNLTTTTGLESLQSFRKDLPNVKMLDRTFDVQKSLEGFTNMKKSLQKRQVEGSESSSESSSASDSIDFSESQGSSESQETIEGSQKSKEQISQESQDSKREQTSENESDEFGSQQAFNFGSDNEFNGLCENLSQVEENHLSQLENYKKEFERVETRKKTKSKRKRPDFMVNLDELEGFRCSQI